MKKPRRGWLKIILYGISFVLVIGLGILGYHHIVPTTSYSHALVMAYDDLNDMEDHAELIVQVSVAGKGRNEVRKDLEGEGRSHYTYTPLKIDKVYKGDVRQGSTIELVEPVGYERLPEGLFFIGYLGYTPIQKKSSYLLFLEKVDSGAYAICGLYQGKFVWPPPQELTPEKLEVDSFGGHYQKLFEEVVAKYAGLD
ncbi:MAG: hypothetical protein ACOX21_00810 [Bacillota bacterium]|jgi:hypothetical protein|nr:hypothetical protein [Bacillota bacterium]